MAFDKHVIIYIYHCGLCRVVSLWGVVQVGTCSSILRLTPEQSYCFASLRSRIPVHVPPLRYLAPIAPACCSFSLPHLTLHELFTVFKIWEQSTPDLFLLHLQSWFWHQEPASYMSSFLGSQSRDLNLSLFDSKTHALCCNKWERTQGIRRTRIPDAILKWETNKQLTFLDKFKGTYFNSLTWM